MVPSGHLLALAYPSDTFHSEQETQEQSEGHQDLKSLVEDNIHSVLLDMEKLPEMSTRKSTEARREGIGLLPFNSNCLHLTPESFKSSRYGSSLLARCRCPPSGAAESTDDTAAAMDELELACQGGSYREEGASRRSNLNYSNISLPSKAPPYLFLPSFSPSNFLPLPLTNNFFLLFFPKLSLLLWM